MQRGLSGTYRDVLAEADGNPSYTLVDASIRLDHTPGFPRGDVERISKELEENHVAHAMLKRMVVNHFYLYEVDRTTREEVCGKMGIKLQPQKVLGGRAKRAPSQKPARG